MEAFDAMVIPEGVGNPPQEMGQDLGSAIMPQSPAAPHGGPSNQNITLTLVSINARLTAVEQQNTRILTMLTEIKQMLPAVLSGRGEYMLQQTAASNVFSGRM